MFIFRAIIFAVLILLPSAIFAQEYDSKGEAFINFGRGVTYDDEGSLGSGFNVGGGIGYHLTRKLKIEAEVNRIPFEREFSSGVRTEGTSVFVNANAVYHFSDSRARPYVIGGVGLLHYKNRSDFSAETPPDRSTSNGFAYNFGGGIKGYLTKKLSIRPEVRLYSGNLNRLVRTEPPLRILQVSVGFGYNW